MASPALAVDSPAIRQPRRASPWIYALFFVSGCPALVYQIVWQRALFAIYGTNMESVTTVVTAFMLGLGLGSLAGGRLSRIERLPALRLFGLMELAIGAFGFFSLRLFHFVGSHSAGAPLFAVGMLTFLLVLLPTMLMGATLPFLVAYLVRISRNVGASVGILYFVNTLGSAFACFLCARFTMRVLGESGSVMAAAAVNGAVAILALAADLRRPASLDASIPESAATPAASDGRSIPFPLALILACASGFIALSYELLWYRAYSFATGTLAPAFAMLLGAYLEGIALGSLFARGLCNRQASRSGRLRAAAALLAGSGVAAFCVVPVMSRMVAHVSYVATLPLVALAAAVLGALFPLLTHLSVAPDGKAGSGTSYLYLANIIGSTAGTALVGFVLMDFLSMRQISVLLLLAGLLLGALLYAGAARRGSRPAIAAAALAMSAAGYLGSGHLYDRIYERMLPRGDHQPVDRFAHLLESRSGVVAVTEDGTVFGGGIYDGRFHTSLINDTNLLVRAYAVPALHPSPRNVLMIGLASGSWAQVIANAPNVERVTIIEINPSYLELIPQYADVASLLRNPKVTIEIDDGRRWLVRHPERKFDVVIMNTSFNWRAHMSNLLSRDFLRIVHQRLNPGGVLFYNTTWSEEVQITGVSEFAHGLLMINFLAVSDRPLAIDKKAWRDILTAWRIDGRPVLNLDHAADRARLEEVLGMADGLEYADSIRRRCRNARIITDDNMGTEWTGPRR